jgi:hypothetical protein
MSKKDKAVVPSDAELRDKIEAALKSKFHEVPPLPTRGEIIRGIIEEVYRSMRRNRVVEEYLQVEAWAHKDDPRIIGSLAQVQRELKAQPEYLLYLLGQLEKADALAA